MRYQAGVSYAPDLLSDPGRWLTAGSR
jgi:hypothetical protein